MVCIVIHPNGINIPANEITDILKNTETVLQEYIVPTAKRFFLYKINVNGTASAIIRWYLNNGYQESTRTSHQDRKGIIEYPAPAGIPLKTGDTIKVTVEHQGSFNDHPQTFQSNIEGGILDDY